MLATPAFAQEVQTQTTPPPAPVEQAAPATPAAPAAPVFAPSAPVVQAVPDYSRAAPSTSEPSVAEAAAEPAGPVRRTTTRTARATTSEPAPIRSAAAPVAATPPVETPAPSSASPTQPAEATAPVAPVTEAATDTAATQTGTPTTSQGQGAIWPWIVGAGVVLLGLIALLAGRRRRADDAVAYEEPVYEPVAEVVPRAMPEPVMVAPMVAVSEPQLVRPTAVADPVAAPAPVPAEETKVVAADDADVAALTDGHAPVADRPWLEFAMRPVRAGTTSDEALVEIELTVGNAGSVIAEDVRISTFLFAAEPANAEEFERLLLEHGDDAGTEHVDIDAGEGTRIDATLALPKRDLAAMFNPVVVADARYRLADGSEGRTYASFAIGLTQEDGGFGGIENNRPSMHEDIEARLYGTPQHA
ncbi:hypothetical protein AB5I39_03625 [Sphingomonas sp. MMS24-J45]|uniref:hypothetical protein n=1 Tax=Sphingomonas sp. MMS24-J45 TaxID=3238806 RepID=UPI00384D8D72